MENNKRKFITVKQDIVDKWIKIFNDSKENTNDKDEIDFLDYLIRFITECKENSVKLVFPTLYDVLKKEKSMDNGKPFEFG